MTVLRIMNSIDVCLEGPYEIGQRSTQVGIRNLSYAPQEITPWEVKGGMDGKIDYEKLSRDVSSFYKSPFHA